MSDCQSASLTISLSVPPLPASLPLFSLSVCPSLCLCLSLAQQLVCVPSPRFVCTVNQYACKSAPSGPSATGPPQHRCCSVAARFTIICHQPRLSSRQLTLACGISFVVYYGLAYKCGLHVALDCIAPTRLVSLSLSLSARLSVCLPVSIIHAKRPALSAVARN